MRQRPLHLAVLVLLGALAVGCAGPGEGLGQRAAEQVEAGLDRARDAVGGLSDDDRFCLAVTRTVTAIESGSPAPAQEAAEEVLAQAPDDLTEQAREVVEALQRALSEGDADLRTSELQQAVDALRADVAVRCDPS